MEYIYAVMLLNKAGKEVSEANVSEVLKAAGVTVDSAKVKSLIAALEGVDIAEVIANSNVAVASGPVAEVAKEEVKKEEVKKEAAPAVDASAGLGSLF